MLVLYWALNIIQECNKRHGCPWCSSNSHSSGTSISCRSFWFRFHWYAWRSSFFCFQEIGIPCIQVNKVQLFFCLYAYNKFGLSVHVIILTSMYICSHAYVTLFIIFFLHQPTNCSEPIWCCNKAPNFGIKGSWNCKRFQGYLSSANLEPKKKCILLLSIENKKIQNHYEFAYVCVNLPYLMCPATSIFWIWN